jgi:hypothetical protein
MAATAATAVLARRPLQAAQAVLVRAQAASLMAELLALI